MVGAAGLEGPPTPKIKNEDKWGDVRTRELELSSVGKCWAVLGVASTRVQTHWRRCVRDREQRGGRRLGLWRGHQIPFPSGNRRGAGQ